MGTAAVTVPVFIFVVIGYISRKTGIIGEETANFLSKITYYLAMPALIFRSIVMFDFESTFRINLVAHNVTVTVIVFAVMFFASLLIKDSRKRGSFHMGCFRSNQGYMGLPLTGSFYGSAAVSRASIVNSIDSPVVIVLSVISLGIFVNWRGNRNRSTAAILAGKAGGFVVHPFVLSAAAGLLLAYYRVPVLQVRMIDEFLKISGYMAMPLALILVGCSVSLGHIKANIIPIAVLAVVKLLLMPALAYVTAVTLFDLKGLDLAIAVILPSMPTAVSSYVMAREMGFDDKLMAAAIGFTTFVSVVTVTAVQFVFGTIVSV